MKFYSKVLGGRDYSLLEAVHFGLRLPALISSFGEVRSVSISDWSVVKKGDALKYAKRNDRATFYNKRELFDQRQHLARPNTVTEDDLKNLSMYAFWRLFDVVKKIFKKQEKEQIVALNGSGWPKHAKFPKGCQKHEDYCKRTLLAYMPCPGLEGTSYIVNAVHAYYGKSLPRALWFFVMDPKNRWCPTWIVRNYEVHNNCTHGLPRLSAPPAPPPHQHDENSDDKEMFPHSKHYNVKFKFSRSGEPEAAEHADEDDPNENLVEDDRWAASNRTGWQQHSAAGPNVRPEGRMVHVSPLESVVNPPDFNYDENEFHVRLDDARHTWETLQDVSHQYTDET